MLIVPVQSASLMRIEKMIDGMSDGKPPPRTENRDGGFVMQGFADILPHSDTECPQPLGFPRGRGRTFR